MSRISELMSERRISYLEAERVAKQEAKGSFAEPNCSAIPRALFSCSMEYCREEVSYYADQLHWYDTGKRWVCEYCWENLPLGIIGDEVPEKGISLESFIKSQNLTATDLLQNAQAH